MKALLLRIGIDKGTDGALAPIFEDGTFEYIPISERDYSSSEKRNYSNTYGRHGKPFSTYLPKKIEKRIMHFDPEFETYTYGDPTPKKNYLKNLNRDDLLVFYAGLSPFKTTRYKNGLFIIGFFTVEKVIDFNEMTRNEILNCFEFYSNNAHMKRESEPKNLIIVVGKKENSRLLEKAVLISEPKYNKADKPYHAVSKKMEKLLGISGSIQRSIPPRIIINEQNLTNLKSILAFNHSKKTRD